MQETRSSEHTSTRAKRCQCMRIYAGEHLLRWNLHARTHRFSSYDQPCLVLVPEIGGARKQELRLD